MDKVKLRSINVRGMRDNRKRIDIFNHLKGEYLNNKGHDIVVLVDTHCHFEKDVTKWSKEWSSNKSNSIWCKGTQHQKGVAILINENFRNKHPDLIVSEPIIDPNGRYIKVFLSIFGQKFRLLAVYAPPIGPNRVIFFQNLRTVMEDEVEDADNIYGGTGIAQLIQTSIDKTARAQMTWGGLTCNT